MQWKRNLLSLLRPDLSPKERSLRQRRRLVKFGALVVLAIFGVMFLGFVLLASPSQLSGGEIGVLAAVGAVLFGSRLVSAARRVRSFRRRR